MQRELVTQGVLKTRCAKWRENACDHVAIGFGSVSDWLSRWRESVFTPITELS